MERKLYIQLDDDSVFEFFLDDDKNPVTYRVDNTYLIVDYISDFKSPLVYSESKIFIPFSHIVSFNIQSFSNLEDNL